ncbi:MAG: 1-deoxy-D-xylulose-5-phosphate synthase, partial [Clostridium sp.]|nr:1-deoxy-D-xylulose-5-phosphate synthase [Clostridium sp.]
MSILKDVYKEPGDIRKMSLTELDILSKEIREFLIENVSKTGGHLAPNLGVVELTLSIFNVFDMEKDKIIYDVGHQSYIHKMLTGRLKGFKTLRQFNGLSGFPKCCESPYDAFDTGHSSTSISAGLGMARARDLKGEKKEIVALIGDGALTGGMALEALNDLGASKTNLTVILNDNEMSISRNVGGISLYLSRFRGDPTYVKTKSDIKDFVNIMPLGKSINRSMDRFSEGVKSMLVPGMLFENMGLKYLGPVDGHNIKETSKILETAKNYNGPVIVHVVTKKGKGYTESEKRPDKFHGVSPFNKENGKVHGKDKVSYSKVFGDTLLSLARKNKDIVAVTAAMPDSTGLGPFQTLYPKRVFDVGIAEQHAVTLAAGLASGGMKPYVAIYSTFYQRAYDQVIHDVCIDKKSVVLCIDRAGLVGDDGETHQGILDLSFLIPVPNLTIMSPKSTKELKYIIKYSENFKGPLAIRYPRGGDYEEKDYKALQFKQGEISFEALKTFEKGKFELIKDGLDVNIYATGKMVQRAIMVAKKLEEDGI